MILLGIIGVSVTLLVGIGIDTYQAYGQSSLSNEFDQQNKEKFLELGEEEFRKDCYKNRLDMPKSLLDVTCESMIDKIKNETATFQQNQTLESTTEPITYETHRDTENGFSVEYPSDWHVGDYGYKISKGTREFTISAIDNPKLSLLDTYNFGQITFEVDKERDGVKITETPGRVNIDGEPAFTYSYAEDGNEIMTMALMHNSIAYTFKYETLKENFDKDSDIRLHFFGTIKFLD